MVLSLQVAIVYNFHQTMLVDDFLWDKIDGDADILAMFWILKWCTKIVILMSIVIKLAPGLEIVPFISILMVFYVCSI